MSDLKPPQDIFAAIGGKRDQLSPKLAGIASYALEKPEQFIRNTSREICSELNTSEPTLIKFCQTFGYSGLSEFRIDFALALARGGVAQGFVEPLTTDRRQVNSESKLRIARQAAIQVSGDQSLLIDNGSTAEAFARALADLPAMTVMTNGILVAQNAMTHKRHTVMLTGGRIRPNSMSLTGPLVESSLGQMRFDTFVMGAASIDATYGLSTFQEDEAQVTRRMMDAAQRVIVLADKTKFLKPALHRICDMGQVDLLVTDLPPNDPKFMELEAQGLRVISAAQNEELPNARV
ncbi:DeoR/GlpR family DNA-binding transcription regulator [Candidatus Rhodobacter oscarellae]|uniref:DeoR/GlpR family DNA-binding transcription regulator n=1 Tax=Candidatus Rhodobacter oscarellae TaxID=1675527 RepID=UPI000AF0C869|nr:transcriptional regulator [Candidatus Rhodobacter lobularis]